MYNLLRPIIYKAFLFRNIIGLNVYTVHPGMLQSLVAYLLGWTRLFQMTFENFANNASITIVSDM